MSTSTRDPVQLFTLPESFGSLYIVGNFAAILFGLSNVQALIYFQTHRDTKMTFLKLAIICLCALDGLQLALIIQSDYYYLVTNNATITTVTQVIWSFKLQVVITKAIIYMVHLLYVYRIWIVSTGRSRILPLTVGTIAVLVLGVYITMFWELYRCRVMEDLIGIVWMAYVALATITTVDVILASSLCYLLATSRTGFHITDSTLTKLIVYTINTGCLTSVFSIIGIITCAVIPKNFIFLGVEFMMAQLYVNSFLAFLNARYYLRPNKGIVDSSKYHVNRGVYRPELHVNVSQDRSSRTFRSTAMFKHLDEEAPAVDLTRPDLAAMK